jgi:hypothetical protein
MNTLVNEAADIITGTYGRLTITYRRLTYTWTVTVYSGTLRIDELCATYDNKVAAWREAQRIALAAHQGKTVRQIEAEKPSELTLAEAKRIIDGVNANMDAAQPKPVDVSDIVDGMPVGGSLAALRRNVRRDFSRTRVSSQEPTEAELGRIRAARRNNDGTLTVTRAPGQPWTVLKALHVRLGGEPTYKPGTARVIDALTYRPEQLAAYAEELAA